MIGMYCDLLLVTLTLLFWNLSCSFAELVENYHQKIIPDDHVSIIQISMDTEVQENSFWWDIKKQLRTMQKLCDGVNRVIAAIVTLTVAELSFYYSVDLDAFFMLRSKDWLKIILSIFWFANTGSILYFAADGCFKVNQFKYLNTLESTAKWNSRHGINKNLFLSLLIFS